MDFGADALDALLRDVSEVSWDGFLDLPLSCSWGEGFHSNPLSPSVGHLELDLGGSSSLQPAAPSFMLPNKALELKLSSEEYDRHISEQLRLCGPLNPSQTLRVKEQRKRIRNREAASTSRMKKKSTTGSLEQDNARLKDENSTLHALVAQLSKDVEMWRERCQQQEKNSPAQQNPSPLLPLHPRYPTPSSQSLVHPPKREEEPRPSPLQEPLEGPVRLWRINNRPMSHTVPVLFTSFVILFTVAFFLPFFGTPESRIALLPPSNGVSYNPHAGGPKAAAPRFHPPPVRRGILTIQDQANDSLALVIEDEEDTPTVEPVWTEAAFHLDDLTSVLLIQSLGDLHHTLDASSFGVIDLILPSDEPESFVLVSSQILSARPISFPYPGGIEVL